MSVREMQNEKVSAPEMFIQQPAHANADISSGSPLGSAIRFPHSTRQATRHYTFESTDESTAGSTVDQFFQAADTSSLPLNRFDAATLMQLLRQLEDLAKRHAPRIAFKAKGSILLLDLADILAVQAEGNYVSLHHRTYPYLVHESLSSVADKLNPYGFIRIHRSVVVNTSAVEEIQPLPTGEYKLRLRGGKEYVVTRTYKHNLRHLAQLWIGSERLCS